MCISSIGAGEDYLPIPPTSVILNDVNTYKCFNITVVNDEYLESKETFSINITNYRLLPSSINFNDNTAIILEAGSTEIVIEDDDGKIC